MGVPPFRKTPMCCFNTDLTKALESRCRRCPAAPWCWCSPTLKVTSELRREASSSLVKHEETWSYCGESPKKNEGFNQQTMENPFWNSMKTSDWIQKSWWFKRKFLDVRWLFLCDKASLMFSPSGWNPMTWSPARHDETPWFPWFHQSHPCGNLSRSAAGRGDGTHGTLKRKYSVSRHQNGR
jgi:hypothetical protein